MATLRKAVVTKAGISYVTMTDIEESDRLAETNVPPTKDQLLARAAAKRWDVETSGITLPGDIRVSTDLIAQTKIAAAKTAYDNGTLKDPIAFKALTGWLTADAAMLTTVYEAVVSHVERGYATEKAVGDAINAGSITTYDAIEAAAWPKN